MLPLGPYRLDSIQRRLHGPAGEVELSPLASRFLRQLAEQPGTVVSRQALIDALWAGNFPVGDPALHRLVSETRKAIQQVGSEPLIETVQRSGYRLLVADPPAATVMAETPAVVPPPAAVHVPPVPWQRWLLRLLVLVVIVVLLEWLVSTLIGWQWARRYGGG